MKTALCPNPKMILKQLRRKNFYLAIMIGLLAFAPGLASGAERVKVTYYKTEPREYTVKNGGYFQDWQVWYVYRRETHYLPSGLIGFRDTFVREEKKPIRPPYDSSTKIRR